MDGNVLNGVFTDAASRIDVQLTASDNQLAGPSIKSRAIGATLRRGHQVAARKTGFQDLGTMLVSISGNSGWLLMFGASPSAV